MIGSGSDSVHNTADDILKRKRAKEPAIRGFKGGVIFAKDPDVMHGQDEIRVDREPADHAGAAQGGDATDVGPAGVVGVLDDDEIVDMDAVEEGLGGAGEAADDEAVVGGGHGADGGVEGGGHCVSGEREGVGERLGEVGGYEGLELGHEGGGAHGVAQVRLLHRADEVYHA